MSTLKEIAKLANVSTATVSHVLNNTAKISEETRMRVMEIVKQLNYKPNSIAKSLKMKKTNTIGIITEDITVFNTPEIINGIDEFAEKSGYHIILSNIRLYKRLGDNFDNTGAFKRVISKVTDILLSKRVDGIIYIACYYRDVKDCIANLDIPIVYSYCFSSDPKDIWISNDDEQGAYEITNHLIKLGHKKIGVIAGKNDTPCSPNRLKGHHRALYENKIMFNPEYLKDGYWQYDASYKAAQELLSLPDRPTAIFAFSDFMAGAVIETAKGLNLSIPADISLVGFDNRECSSAFSPGLTTMAMPLNDIGLLSARRLIERIEGKAENKDKHILLPCKLVERNSVARNSKERTK